MTDINSGHSSLEVLAREFLLPTLALVLSLTAVGTARPSAQGSPASKPASAVQVLGIGHFSPIVADLDRTVAFYRDVVGLEIATDPPSTWDAEPWLRRLHGTPRPRAPC